MYPPYYDPEDRKLRYYASLGKAMKKREKAKRAAEVKAQQSSRRMMTSLEWFVIGILMQPVVGPLYHLAVIKITTGIQ